MQNSLVVHLLEECGDSRRGHEAGPPRDDLADVAEAGAVLVGDGLRLDPDLLEAGLGAVVLPHRVRLDLGAEAGEEGAWKQASMGVVSSSPIQIQGFRLGF